MTLSFTLSISSLFESLGELWGKERVLTKRPAAVTVDFGRFSTNFSLSRGRLATSWIPRHTSVF